ncbi:MAG: AGE family epimerase/isomerase [Prevotella sp.]|nr:AGE family epimerase/isomerase [Prevotella sp.]
MTTIATLKADMRQTLDHHILDYWLRRMTDHEHSGFYGRADGHDHIHPEADKGAILNARILWAFSAAYRVTRNPDYLSAATRARDYLIDFFVDREFGGVYWSLNYLGQPVDTKKQTYAIGFAIYGLSEYARATGDALSLQTAIALYHDIEAHAFDRANNGYTEALTREWQPIEDMRLSDKDENGAKTMNTHLHVLEPYTNLYRVWPDEGLRGQLRNLIDLFLDKIWNPDTHHLDLFFDNQWNGKRNVQSYGHDIEAVWLLHEAALVLNEAEVIERVERVIPLIAEAADEGLQSDGSLIYEHWTDSGDTDRQRQWWVMCECIIGHIDLYQHFGDRRALDITLRCWDYTRHQLIDYEQGEWFWGRHDDGSVNRDDDKAGFWKCPYHNSRMCLELMERNLPEPAS